MAFTDGTSTGKVDAKKEAMVTKEWDDKKAEVIELAKGKNEGRKTRLKKLKQVEIEVEFPTPEANLDEAATETAIKSALDTVKPAGATVTTKSATKYGVTGTKCAMRVKVALPEATADADVEKMATDFAAKTISGTTTRRGAVSGTVTGSAQSTTAEAYGAAGVSGVSGTDSSGAGGDNTGLVVGGTVAGVVVLGGVLFAVYSTTTGAAAAGGSTAAASSGVPSIKLGEADAAAGSVPGVTKQEV